MHWVPYRGDQGLQFDQDIGSSDKFTLWVRAVEEGLPLMLHSFGATTQDRAVRIDWTIIAANKAEYIEIERSVDGIHWLAIDRQAIEPSAAFFSDNYLDRDPLMNTRYYRLRQTDYDGAVDFSHVISVSPLLEEATAEPRLYPNPTSGQLIIAHASPDVKVVIVRDTRGARVAVHAVGGRAGSEPIVLDLSALPSGVYFCQLGVRMYRIVRR